MPEEELTVKYTYTRFLQDDGQSTEMRKVALKGPISLVSGHIARIING